MGRLGPDCRQAWQIGTLPAVARRRGDALGEIMSEDFRDGPAPAEDAGRQVRLVTLAAGVGAVLLVASVVVDVAWADEPVTPELPGVPRPTLPTDLPSGFPT